MKALVAVLVAVGWAMKAGAAYLLGVIHEHIETHELDGNHRGGREK